MSAILRISRLATRGLLKLHPRAYRDDFEDEVYAVLSASLGEAEAEGRGALARAGGREVLGLGASLVREQWTRFDRNGPSRPSTFGWNSVVLASAFLLLRLGSGISSLATIGACLVLGGASGLLLRSIGRSRRRIRDRIYLGAVTFLVAELAIDVSAHLITAWWAPDTMSWMVVTLLVVEPIIRGVCLAALFSALVNSGQPTLRLVLQTGLASVSGAGIGLTLVFVTWALSQMLDSWRIGYDGSLSPWVVGLNQALFRFAVVGAAGWFAGGQLRSRALRPGSPGAAHIA